jgi:hypothetical protein
MRLISEKTRPNGARRVSVELAEGERLFAVRQDDHYRLAEPMHEDIVKGHVLHPRLVVWCSLSQTWVDAA